MGRRIGIYGGTFDPVHVGHLVAAVNARHALRLDVVLLVVANRPWQKEGSRVISDARDRLDVVAAAVADIPGLEPSAIEIERGGASYTADTVAALRAAEPDAELFLIVGTDVADDMETWDRAAELRECTTLCVVNRPSAPRLARGSLVGWRVEEVDMPALDISSTDLRERARDGRPLDFLVPDRAVRVIRERGMYDLGE